MQRVEARPDHAIEAPRRLGFLERAVPGPLAREVLREIPLEAGLSGGGDLPPSDAGLVRLQKGTLDVGGESGRELDPALLAGVLPQPELGSSRARGREHSQPGSLHTARGLFPDRRGAFIGGDHFGLRDQPVDLAGGSRHLGAQDADRPECRGPRRFRFERPGRGLRNDRRSDEGDGEGRCPEKKRPATESRRRSVEAEAKSDQHLILTLAPWRSETSMSTELLSESPWAFAPR